MRALKTLLIVLSILIVSCSTKTYFISFGYEGKIIPDAVMLIPNLENCKVSDKSNIFTDAELTILENHCLKQFNNIFGNVLQSKSTLRKVYSIKFKNDPGKKKRVLRLNEKENISLELPSKPIKLDSAEATYILHIENFELTIFEESLDSSDPAKHYNISTPAPGNVVLAPAKFMGQYFLVTFNYAIIENNSLDLVCYGRMNVKDKLKKDVEFEKTLSNTFDKIAAKILKETPFEK